MSGVLAKIDSNITGLRYAEEATLGVLPTTPVWVPLEPNSYDDFGGELTTVARSPINPSRQRKKGVITDLNANGGFNTDLTQFNLQDILQGLMFADLRRKGEFTNVGAITATTLGVSNTTGFFAGALVQTTGMNNVANNRPLDRVTAVAANSTLTMAGAYTVGTGGAASRVVVVGFQFASGDAQIDAAGNFAALTTTAKNLTELGVIPGEWVFVSGDAVANRYDTPVNNGWKRVRSVAANRITFDKSDAAMVTDTGAGKTIQIFLGRVLKNELGTLIKRRSYQLERTLGAPVIATPNAEQAEYLIGSVPNEATFNIPQAEKLTVDLSFISTNNETRDTVAGLKTGTRPALTEADAFNTSSDFSRLRMALVSTTDEAPTPLFAYLTELSINIKNNLTPNKAVAVLGSFDVTAGTFEVSAEITAYFSTVQAILAVRNNSDVTLDSILVKNNSGIAFDIPLIALGNGRLDVEKDNPITLPLTAAAATAAKIDPNLDHSMLMVFFDYLPNAADL